MLPCSPFQQACTKFGRTFLRHTGMAHSVALQTTTAHIPISRIKLCLKNHLILLDKSVKWGDKNCKNAYKQKCSIVRRTNCYSEFPEDNCKKTMVFSEWKCFCEDRQTKADGSDTHCGRALFADHECVGVCVDRRCVFVCVLLELQVHQ